MTAAAVSYDATATAPTPTAATYGDLNRAYAFFNKRLFSDRLPQCLITLQRHRGAYGYFAPERFGALGARLLVDEIALNPSHFTRPLRDILATLVHEMAHLEQQHFGKPSRNGYHNKEWAGFMKLVGLQPSSTAREGGKETGPKVSHYIIDGGRYAAAFADLAAEGFTDLLSERWSDDEQAKKARAKKNASKTPFECPDCQLKAWAKASASLWCGDCQIAMECQGDDANEGDDE